jgi:hypothetical protein
MFLQLGTQLRFPAGGIILRQPKRRPEADKGHRGENSNAFHVDFPIEV